MLLIGSHALNVHRAINGRPMTIHRDMDYICTHDEAVHHIKAAEFTSVIPSTNGGTLMCFREGEKPTELMIAWPDTSTEVICKKERGVASLNTLLLLKTSHRYLKNSPHFEKTRNDILELRSMGAVIEDEVLLKQREKETYTYAHPNLGRDKTKFFDPREVQYKYDHDSIHTTMAIEKGVPAYTKYQPAERKGVMTSRQMFDGLPLEVRLNGVLEETYVLALERSQIPFRGTVEPEKSFKMALQKVCTSITSGWFREFAWEHYDEVLALYDPKYVEKFDIGVAAGTVLPFKAEAA